MKKLRTFLWLFVPCIVLLVLSEVIRERGSTGVLVIQWIDGIIGLLCLASIVVGLLASVVYSMKAKTVQRAHSVSQNGASEQGRPVPVAPESHDLYDRLILRKLFFMRVFGIGLVVFVCVMMSWAIVTFRVCGTSC